MEGIFQVININNKTGVAKVLKQDENKVYEMYDKIFQVNDKFIIEKGEIKILSRINQGKIEEILNR